MPTRRETLFAGVSAPLAIGSGAKADPHPAQENTIKRIAFGSCAKQTKPQPIWDAIVKAKPDVFIFLGDNVYIDSRNIADYKPAYDLLAAKPGFQKLRATTPILAIWDDHDFGGVPYKQWAKKRTDAKLTVPGPYERDPRPSSTQLGTEQWSWLVWDFTSSGLTEVWPVEPPDANRVGTIVRE